MRHCRRKFPEGGIVTGAGSFDRASDREKVAALLGILVGALVILVAFSLWLPPARTAEAQGTPGQVMGVSASADGHDSITVSWNAVTSTCGSNSLYYEARWDDDSGFASPQDEDYIPNTTDRYRITGLQEGTPYFVQVRGVCVNVFGFYTAEGEWSAASATTDLQPPERVTGVIADATSDVEIRVSWMMAIRAGGYVVQWREDGRAFEASRQAAVTALTYDVTGLTADTRYYFQVIATRAGATHAVPSDEAGATTENAPTLGQVTSVAATALSDRELQVTWTAAANATGYAVQWDTDSAFSGPEEATVPAAGAIIEGLRAETEYFVRVKGTRAGAADGAWSAADTATTETARLMVWADRVPGGTVGAQLGLAVFGGVFAGFRFRTMKTPRREALILLCMCGASLLLPLFGVGNLFWTGGIVLLAAASSAAVFFLASRA